MIGCAPGVCANAYAGMRAWLLTRALAFGLNSPGLYQPLGENPMGFDFDRSEAGTDTSSEGLANSPVAHTQPVVELMRQALKQNLVAEQFAIDAYRQIAAHGESRFDKAAMRLVKVALAVEEEHAEILSTLLEDPALRASDQ